MPCRFSLHTPNNLSLIPRSFLESRKRPVPYCFLHTHQTGIVLSFSQGDYTVLLHLHHIPPYCSNSTRICVDVTYVKHMPVCTRTHTITPQARTAHTDTQTHRHTHAHAHTCTHTEKRARTHARTHTEKRARTHALP